MIRPASGSMVIFPPFEGLGNVIREIEGEEWCVALWESEPLTGKAGTSNAVIVREKNPGDASSWAKSDGSDIGPRQK